MSDLFTRLSGCLTRLLFPLLALAAAYPASAGEPLEELGRELFRDVSLGNPGTKIQASCALCHIPPSPGDPSRIYSDVLPRSLLPGDQRDVAAVMLRNTPALPGAAEQPYFNFDGSYDSLEALIAAKLTGPELGWAEGDRERAKVQIHTVLINDAGAPPHAPYSEQFSETLGIDVDAVDADAALAATTQAIAAFVRALKPDMTSPWDAFAAINRVAPGPSEDEPIDLYAGRVRGRLENQAARQLLKRPEAFSQTALDGFKIFFKIEGEGPIGNCVTCHIPPSFSDGRFHNTGIAAREYEAIHGSGSFARLPVPPADRANRPDPRFLSIPNADDPEAADLGHWNYVDLKDSPQRLEGESDEDFLARMTATFRTPSLRNIGASAPYMHNGAYPTLEDAVREIVKLSHEARDGTRPGLAPEFAAMRLEEEHIAPLVAFLEALQDRGRDGFRQMLIDVVQPDFDELERY
jgi:cytochrome c peroxidase